MPSRIHRGRRSKRIQDVRIADATAGPDGTKIDRMISSLQSSESQVRVLCAAVVDVNTATSADIDTYGFDEVFQTDDFQSMSQQFNTFRITAMKFDVYDTNPSLVASNNWSTYHNETDDAPIFDRAQIVDGPDSRVLSGGTGQTTLYWRAHGTQENNFQSTLVDTYNPQRFGGLRYYHIGGQAGPKYEIVVHAVVDFRGRK